MDHVQSVKRTRISSTTAPSGCVCWPLWSRGCHYGELIEIDEFSIDITTVIQYNGAFFIQHMLPEPMARLKSLTCLRLVECRLCALPEWLGEFAQLRELVIIHHPTPGLTIPESIGRLSALEHLDLTNNRLTTLPSSMDELQNLKTLYLDSNPLPQDLLASCSTSPETPFARDAFHAALARLHAARSASSSTSAASSSTAAVAASPAVAVMPPGASVATCAAIRTLDTWAAGGDIIFENRKGVDSLWETLSPVDCTTITDSLRKLQGSLTSTPIHLCKLQNSRFRVSAQVTRASTEDPRVTFEQTNTDTQSTRVVQALPPIPKVEQKIAFITANSYVGSTAQNVLPGAERHLADVTSALTRLGFNVWTPSAGTSMLNLSQAQFEGYLNKFKQHCQTLSGTLCQLVYYTGHGCANGRYNFMITADSKPFLLERIATDFLNPEAIKIVVSDTCRCIGFRTTTVPQSVLDKWPNLLDLYLIHSTVNGASAPAAPANGISPFTGMLCSRLNAITARGLPVLSLMKVISDDNARATPPRNLEQFFTARMKEFSFAPCTWTGGEKVTIDA